MSTSAEGGRGGAQCRAREIRERQRHRERIAQLAAGDSLALPLEAVAYLDRLRSLGLPDLMIEGERDAWILVAAQLPEHMSLYIKLKQQHLDDPATVELYRNLAAAIDWEADDPRLAAVGDRLVALLEAADAEGWENHDDEMTDELVKLLDSVFLDSVPIAHPLADLASIGNPWWLDRPAARRERAPFRAIASSPRARSLLLICTNTCW